MPSKIRRPKRTCTHEVSPVRKSSGAIMGLIDACDLVKKGLLICFGDGYKKWAGRNNYVTFPHSAVDILSQCSKDRNEFSASSNTSCTFVYNTERQSLARPDHSIMQTSRTLCCDVSNPVLTRPDDYMTSAASSEQTEALIRDSSSMLGLASGPTGNRSIG